MSLPILIDNRLRRFGAAVIGYLGAVAYGVALMWTMNGWPSDEFDRGSWLLILLLAPFGAVSGWLVIDRLGRPGWRGLLQDIGVAMAALILTFTVAVFCVFPPIALFSMLIVLSGLFKPLIAPVTVIGCAVLLAYARLTAPKAPKPATSPRA